MVWKETGILDGVLVEDIARELHADALVFFNENTMAWELKEGVPEWAVKGFEIVDAIIWNPKTDEYGHLTLT